MRHFLIVLETRKNPKKAKFCWKRKVDRVFWQNLLLFLCLHHSIFTRISLQRSGRPGKGNGYWRPGNRNGLDRYERCNGLKELCQERPTCLEAIKCDDGTETSNPYAEKRQSMSQKIKMLEHIKERARGSIGSICQHILNTKRKEKTMLVCTNDMLDFVFKEFQVMFI